MNKKKLHRRKRQLKIRRVISGTSKRPRLSVFKSNKYIYAQLISDVDGKTVASASGKKGANAFAVGKLLAQKALLKKIKNVVFDRGGFAFHGRVKSLADGARNGGLNF